MSQPNSKTWLFSHFLSIYIQFNGEASIGSFINGAYLFLPVLTNEAETGPVYCLLFISRADVISLGSGVDGMPNDKRTDSAGFTILMSRLLCLCSQKVTMVKTR